MAIKIAQIAVDSTAAQEITIADMGGAYGSQQIAVQLLTGTEVWIGRSATMVAAPAAGNESWRVQAGSPIALDNLATDERLWVRCASGLTALVNVMHQDV